MSRSVTTLLFLLPLALPSWLHLPTWMERVLYNSRERTAAGIEALAEGDEDAAVRRLETAHRLAPEDPKTSYNLGTGLLATDPTAGVEELEGAADLVRNDVRPDLFYNIGNGKLEGGDPAGAVEAYKQALRERHDFADAKHNLELALQELEKQRRRDQQDAEQEQSQPQQRPNEQESEQQQQEPQEQQDEQEQENNGAGQPETRPQPDSGEEQPQSQPQPPEESEQQPRPLPGFEDQPEMTAEEAAAILEAVENLERDQRRQQARESARRERREEKDW